MTIGIVSAFDRRTGGGSITPEGGGAEVQVHVGALERAGLSGLEIGDRVSYDVMASGARGARFATNLRLL